MEEKDITKSDNRIGKPMFTQKQIYQLMIPLMIEQLLTVTVGAADSMMVSVAGEAAVSGVSLVDALNNLILQIMAALATGGTVVCSQYLGRKKAEEACKAANQLVFTTVVFGLAVMVLMLAGGRGLLQVIFGQTEKAVMDQSVTYIMIIVISYPFMAIYNSAAALFRSMGNSRISMEVSLLMNVINIIGNAILIFGCSMGVAGAAIATVFSRIVGSLLILMLISRPGHEIHVSDLRHLKPQPVLIKKILTVGIPTGMENGIFQLGKIMVLSMITGYGTASIMANSVANSLTLFMIIPGTYISLAIVTVVGQCIGAGEIRQARRYTWQLVWTSCLMIAGVSMILLLLRPQLLGLYHMSAESYQMAYTLMFWHFIAGLIWPLSFNLPNALRAGNDARYTMIIAMISMWSFRVLLSYVLGTSFGWGLYGVWIAMFVDWIFRTIFFVARFRGEKWHARKLI